MLQVRKYSERKLIVDMVTREHGRATYITSIGRATPRSLFQSFYILDIIATPPATAEGLHQLNEAQISAHCTLALAHKNAARSAIVMMLSEVVLRVARDSDTLLYSFLQDAIRLLNSLSDSTMIANFHLHFMVKLSEILGYAPHNNYTQGSYFDIALGEFTEREPTHNFYLSAEQSLLLYSALSHSLSQGIHVPVNGASRSAFLSSMVDYYGYHTQSIYDVRSIEIFSDIF